MCSSVFRSKLQPVSVLYWFPASPLQYSCLENLMDGGAWQAAVHGVAKTWTQLSDFTFTFHFHALEKEMATHFSVLAWRISGTGEPGGLPSMGSHRVGHVWSDWAAAAASDIGIDLQSPMVVTLYSLLYSTPCPIVQFSYWCLQELTPK